MTTPISDTQNRFGYKLNWQTTAKVVFMIGSIFLLFQLNYRWTRLLHIISGFIWYAMLVFLVIIFLPIIDKFSDDSIYEIIGLIVPRIFHTVTIAGFYTIGLGWYNVVLLANGNHSYFYGSFKDTVFSIAIILVTFMYFFHLFLESSEINISNQVANHEIDKNSEEYQLLLQGLKITPRVGFLVISFAILIMFLR